MFHCICPKHIIIWRPNKLLSFKFNLYPIDDTAEGYSMGQTTNNIPAWVVPTANSVPVLVILDGTQHLFKNVIGYKAGNYPPIITMPQVPGI